MLSSAIPGFQLDFSWISGPFGSRVVMRTWPIEKADRRVCIINVVPKPLLT